MEAATVSGPLIALSDAARLCYHSITGHLTDNATVLTNLSHAIASRTQVFSSPVEGGEVALIWPNEFMEGVLRLGGAYLEFPDGRPTLGYLSILRREVPRLCQELRDHFRRDPSRLAKPA
jgi:hypothetical protein